MMSINLNKPYPTSLTRRRTHLKPSQVAVLQETFVTNTLPDAALRSQLAHELGVTERTVQIWFQNRRAKARKLEASDGSLPPLVPNVRTGWIELPQPIQQQQQQQQQQRHQQKCQELQHQRQKTTQSTTEGYQATFHSFMTPECYENEPMIKRRPRSSSKPEKTSASFLLSTPPPRAMSEDIGRTTSNHQDNQSKPIISFPVQGIHIGSWARFARQISANEWDLFCFSNPISRQLIWQVQDAGHQFRIEVDYNHIQQIRLGQVQSDIGHLDIEIKPKSIVSFSMRRNGIDQDWVRCNDFTENQQASLNQEGGFHSLQGSHDSLRQSLLELMSHSPDLASKLVILPDNDFLCRDLTISPSATPEPSNCNTASWMVDPTKNPWNSTYFQQQQASYDSSSSSWAYLNMLQTQQNQNLLTNNNHNDVVLSPFI